MINRPLSLRNCLQLSLMFLLALASTHILLPAEAAPHEEYAIVSLTDKIVGFLFQPVSVVPSTMFDSPVPPPPPVGAYYAVSAVNSYWDVQVREDPIRSATGPQNIIGPRDGKFLEITSQAGAQDSTDHYYLVVDLGMMFSAGSRLEFYEWHEPQITPGLGGGAFFQVSADGATWSGTLGNQGFQWTSGTPQTWSWASHSGALTSPFRYVMLTYWSNGTWKHAKIDAIRVVQGSPLTSDPRRAIDKEDSCLANGAQHFDGDPVNTSSGHFVYRHEDIHIPTRGLPLRFERSYNSFTPYKTALGYGWTHNYNVRLDLTYAPAVVTVIAPRGSWLTFAQNAGSYYAVYGNQGNLYHDAGSGTYSWVTGDDVSQTTWRFNSAGQLTSIVDVNSNTTSLQYSSGKLTQVSAPDGRALNFSYTDDLITTVTDPISRTIEFSYEQGNLVGVQDTRGHTTVFAYDGLSHIIAITDTNGHTLVRNDYYHQPDNGHVHWQWDALDHASQFSYTEPWNKNQGKAQTYQTTVYDPLGRGTTYRYSEAGLLKEILYPGDKLVRFQYNPADWNLTKITAPNGQSVSYEYNSPCGCRPSKIQDAVSTLTFAYDFFSGQDITAQDSLGNETLFQYDSQGNLAQIIDANDENTTFTYDGYGQLAGMTDAENQTMSFAHDLFGNLRVITDSLGYSTHIEYDGVGRPVDMTDPLGRMTHYEYDAGDNVLSVTRNYQPGSGSSDDVNVTTSLGYDNEGNLTSITDPEGRVSRIVYDARNLVESVTLNYQGSGAPEERDVTTEYEYDEVGNLKIVTDPRGHATRYGYDNLDRVRAITDTLGHATLLTYDDVGNLIKVKDPNGHHTYYGYDAANRLTKIEDELYGLDRGTAGIYINHNNVAGTGYVETVTIDDVVTRYEYDALYRLAKVIEDYGGDNVTTEYEYDAVGNLIGATDPRGHTVAYEYDERHQLEAVHYPQGTLSSRTFDYDVLGRLDEIVDARGTTTLGYDGVDRLAQLQYPNVAAIGFGYDRVGNRTELSDGTGSTSYTYDKLNRLKSVTVSGRTVEYAYDKSGNLTGLTYPGDRTVEYSYNAANRMQYVRDWNNDVVASYLYDNAGRLTGGFYGNDWSFTRHYDDADRLDQVVYASVATQAYYTLTYELDPEGNRVKEIAQGGQPPEHERVFFRYLPIVFKSRTASQAPLISFTPLSLQPFTQTIRYEYDDLNHLDTAYAESGLQYDYDYGYDYGYDDAGNRTSEVTPLATRVCQYDDADRLTSVNGQGYTWDDDGKLTGDASRVFQYDGAGRLTQVVSGTLTTQYAYNGDGDRVSMTVNGQPVAYTLDPSGLTDALEARQGVSVTTYLYGPLGPLAEELPSGQRLYYGRDALGSVRFVMDENGEILNRYEYDPFGNQYYAESEDVAPAFRFAGEQWDASSGLYYLRARYYDPTSGRFVSRDPFPGLVYLPQTLNPYAYVTNNPANLTDPSGEIAPLILAGLFVAGGFLGGAGAYTLYPYVYPDTCGHWDPAYALVWAGGGALLGAGMYGLDYGAVALAVHFGLLSPQTSSFFQLGAQFLQRQGGAAWNYGQSLFRPTVARIDVASRATLQPLTGVQKDMLRYQARKAFFDAHPDIRQFADSIGMKLDVHHRIPLEYAHLFPYENPNQFSNLYATTRQFHWDVINSSWTQFRLQNPNPTAKLVLQHALEVDKLIPWDSLWLYY